MANKAATVSNKVAMAVMDNNNNNRLVMVNHRTVNNHMVRVVMRRNNFHKGKRRRACFPSCWEVRSRLRVMVVVAIHNSNMVVILNKATVAMHNLPVSRAEGWVLWVVLLWSIHLHSSSFAKH